MRKLVAYTLMALDGAVDDPTQYFWPSTDPGDPFDFDDESQAFESATIGTQDAVLLGRGTYDEWSGYWPKVSDHPFADFINGVRKYVATSRPLESTWGNSAAVSGPVAEFVADLKAQPGGDIGLHGSIRLLQSLLREGLVDELRLTVGPAVGTPGRRLFEPLDGPRRMTLASAASTPGGNLLLTYRPG